MKSWNSLKRFLYKEFISTPPDSYWAGVLGQLLLSVEGTKAQKKELLTYIRKAERGLRHRKAAGDRMPITHSHEFSPDFYLGRLKGAQIAVDARTHDEVMERVRELKVIEG